MLVLYILFGVCVSEKDEREREEETLRCVHGGQRTALRLRGQFPRPSAFTLTAN